MLASAQWAVIDITQHLESWDIVLDMGSVTLIHSHRPFVCPGEHRAQKADNPSRNPRNRVPVLFIGEDAPCTTDFPYPQGKKAILLTLKVHSNILPGQTSSYHLSGTDTFGPILRQSSDFLLPVRSDIKCICGNFAIGSSEWALWQAIDWLDRIAMEEPTTVHRA